MKLVAVVKNDPRFEQHIMKELRNLPGTVVIILPETLKKTKAGIRIDVIPEDLRFKNPQPLMLRHLEMDEHTEQALSQAITNKFS